MNLWKNMNARHVEQYIQEVMKQAFGSHYTEQFPFTSPFPIMNHKEAPPSPEFYETDEFIYIKLPMNDDLKKMIKIQHNQHHLHLMNYPEKNQQKKFVFPAPVKRKGTKAVFSDGILEIKFVKLKDHHYTEIDLFPSE
ncbi:Hsp20/alpha crystallin family protein [Aeribacillus pallidus]|nr:Hsp20/alpha crystallin family protein [Aeribacillus pallidus]